MVSFRDVISLASCSCASAGLRFTADLPQSTGSTTTSCRWQKPPSITQPASAHSARPKQTRQVQPGPLPFCPHTVSGNVPTCSTSARPVCYTEKVSTPISVAGQFGQWWLLSPFGIIVAVIFGCSAEGGTGECFPAFESASSRSRASRGAFSQAAEEESESERRQGKQW